MSFRVSEKCLARLEWPDLLARLARHLRTPEARAALAAAPFAESAEAARRRLAETGEARALRAAGAELPFGAIPGARRRARAARQGRRARGRRAARGGRGRARRLGRPALLRPPRRRSAAARRAGRGALGPARARRRDRRRARAGRPRAGLRLARRSPRRAARPTRPRRACRSAWTACSATASSAPRSRTPSSPCAATATCCRCAPRPARACPASCTTPRPRAPRSSSSPRRVVELNNRLKQAELAIERETRRVLAALSEQAAPARRRSSAPDLATLGELDLAFARARLAEEHGRQRARARRRSALRAAPAPAPAAARGRGGAERSAPRRELPRARDLGPERRRQDGGDEGARARGADGARGAPRGGGAGRAGRRGSTPCSPTSATSRTSARASPPSRRTWRTSRAIVAEAGPRTLVLLDEVGVGTDPGEGAALAQAVLEQLADAGARVVVTTHFGLLKEMADVDARFENACVEFDPETLAPTYRLRLGMAGASSARAVAARMGMPSRVLERASGLLAREDRRLDRCCPSSPRAAPRSSASAARRRACARESESARDDYRIKLERLQQRRDQLFASMRSELDAAFQDAHTRGRRRDPRAPARRHGARCGARARAADRRSRRRPSTRRQAQRGRAPEPPAAPSDWRHARPGDRGGRRRASAQARSSRCPTRRAACACRSGARVSSCRPSASGCARRAPSRAAPAVVRVDPLPDGATPARVDVRGRRVDEAMGIVEKALDDAARAGLGVRRDRPRPRHGRLDERAARAPARAAAREARRSRRPGHGRAGHHARFL